MISLISNGLRDIALWGPRDFGFAAWVIKTAKAPGPGEHKLGRDLCFGPWREEIRLWRAQRWADATAVSRGRVPSIGTRPTACRQLSLPPHRVTNWALCAFSSALTACRPETTE